MLQFITDGATPIEHYKAAQTALEGGCRWIQLRMKEFSKEQIMLQAVIIKRLCREYGATFVIDDHVDIAQKVAADGVHLGKNDMSPTEAREILGAKAIIGGTANTIDDIVALVQQGVNYIGLGPFRFTTTKKNLSQLLGIEGYTAIMQQCRTQGINLPIVAIGGIVRSDIATVMATGVTGIALSGAILKAENPRLECTELIIEIENSKVQ